MKITNDPALIAANKVYRSRSYRDGLITGALTGAVVTAWLCGGLFFLLNL